MALQAAAITESTSESGFRAVMAEWLGRYFNGTPHAIGLGAATLFPKCQIAFGQGAPIQPESKGPGAMAVVPPEIRVVTIAKSDSALPAVDGLINGRRGREKVLLQFWITAKLQGTGKSAQAAMRIAELLEAVLRNPLERYDLATCGIVNMASILRRPVEGTNYLTYLVSAAAELTYGIACGTGALVLPANEMQSSFWRENVWVVGEYLTGNITFGSNQKLTYARAAALASQRVATVLGLEVGGTLTGLTLTLPVGSASQQVTADFAPVSPVVYAIPAGAVVKWKILSGPPDGESAAWQGNVEMRTVAN